MRRKMKTPHRRNRQSAFTLIEMLIVMAIMGMLIAVLAVGFGDVFGNSQQQAAELFVKQGIKPGLQQYRMHMGHYPTTEEGLGALVDAPAQGGSHWKGPYVDTLPDDPWGNPYQYRQPGTHNPRSYDIWSRGPDGKDSADDIGNW